VIAYKSFCSGFTLQTNFIQGQFAFYPFFFFFFTVEISQCSHSVAQSCLTLQPHESQHARPPCPFTNSRSSLRLTSIESVMPSSHLILCRPLLLQPPIPPSIRVFSNESTLRMRWPKYWSFSFNIIPSKEIPVPFLVCPFIHPWTLKLLLHSSYCG